MGELGKTLGALGGPWEVPKGGEGELAILEGDFKETSRRLQGTSRDFKEAHLGPQAPLGGGP